MPYRMCEEMRAEKKAAALRLTDAQRWVLEQISRAPDGEAHQLRECGYYGGSVRCSWQAGCADIGNPIGTLRALHRRGLIDDGYDGETITSESLGVYLPIVRITPAGRTAVSTTRT